MFRIRSHEKGIALRLHNLEAAIMSVVWDQRFVLFSVGDVLAVLQKEREIAYTTVMTTVARLHRKGLLERRRDSKRFLYRPTMTRAQFLESTVREVLDSALSDRQALTLLAERVSEASSDSLDEMEKLIDRRRKDLGRR